MDGGTRLVSHETNDGEDDETSKDGSGTVQNGDDIGISERKNSVVQKCIARSSV